MSDPAAFFRSSLQRSFAPVTGALAFLAVWEVACRVFSIRPVLLPGPIAVFGEIFASPVWFAQQTGYTLGITLAGFAAAVVFGVLFAIVIVEWKLLERLLFPTPDEMAKHGCKYQGAIKTPGVLQSTLSCPPTADITGIDATAEITFSATSYEGLGQLTAKDKSGTTIKGSSVLSGKRLGDC